MARSSCRVHETALISPEAEFAPDVTVGAYVIVEGEVRLGPGCVIRPYAHLIGPLRMGRENEISSGAVLGAAPQDVKYSGEPTGVEIGDGNIFRENVTVHRGTAATGLTRIGDGNRCLAGSHVAHDCRVGNGCILDDNALLAGHCTLGDGARVGANAAVHQFCQLGRLAVLESVSIATKDMPPFIIQDQVNRVVGLNREGMRQAGLPADQIEAMARAYDIVYGRGLVLPNALEMVLREVGTSAAVAEFVAFIRQSKRGISLPDA
jgi:UDP-N-acetylglucosamine acyltransferase